MSSVAIVQRKLALPVVGSCQECHWLKPCGGYRDHNGLFGNTCFERHCCGGKSECNYLCNMHPRFTTMFNEVVGLRFDRLPPLTQRRVAVPAYVPSLLHHSGRTRPLEIPFAAVPPKEVLRVRHGHMQAVAADAAGLRERLRLGSKTRVVLNCVQPDEELEKLWEFWVQDDVPAKLSGLGIDLVIGPNFSHFSRVPRTEVLGNRMRHLMCPRDLRVAGLTPRRFGTRRTGNGRGCRPGGWRGAPRRLIRETRSTSCLLTTSRSTPSRWTRRRADGHGQAR